jgi:hypothetical protein
MLTVLGHLPDARDPGRPQQLAQLAELLRLAVGHDRDQVRALAGAPARTLTVD